MRDSGPIYRSPVGGVSIKAQESGRDSAARAARPETGDRFSTARRTVKLSVSRMDQP